MPSPREGPGHVGVAGALSTRETTIPRQQGWRAGLAQLVLASPGQLALPVRPGNTEPAHANGPKPAHPGQERNAAVAKDAEPRFSRRPLKWQACPRSRSISRVSG